MNSVRVAKFVRLENVVPGVTRVIVSMDNCVKMEPVLLDAVIIWIVQVIEPVLMANVLIHV